uniref:Translocating chain-associated membrane protein n=1 Tax=Phallusia mammillata TaxID=59560 RepID=A0A6F9DWG7_9ASCI|nr:Tram1/2 translocating chain-associating membrane protein 1/2 [Phallusia mammillata]
MGMPRKKQKHPPVMSHEFVIQNHADILACVAIVIVLGLISEATSKLSKPFIFLQYGVTDETEEEPENPDAPVPFPKEFGRGILDIFAVFFQALMIAVVHAVIQEYGVDKVSKKLHLSKTKNSKFSESCQLLVWCVGSAGWGIHLLLQNKFISNIALLWEDYPHSVMSWENKLFMLIQMAYWFHMYPELYFQKARKEDIPARIQYYTLHLIFITGAYILNFWRIAIVIATLHYIAEGVFHGCRIAYFAEKNEVSSVGFSVWRILFPVARTFILALSFLMFWFGLGRAENQGIDFATGNFNSFFIRMICLSAICLLQAWLMWPFIQLQIRRSKEEKLVKKKTAALAMVKPKSTKKNQKKSEVDNDVGNGVTTRSGKVKKH